MASVNKVILLGNIGKDPEFKSLNDGNGVVNFSLATSERYKTKDSEEWQERTEWHNCVAYRKVAEVVRDYVRKGNKLYVEGKLQTRSWEDKNTTEIKYRTEIVVFDVKLLTPKNEQNHEPVNQQNGNGYAAGNTRSAGSGGYEYDRGRQTQKRAISDANEDLEITDDDIPF